MIKYEGKIETRVEKSHGYVYFVDINHPLAYKCGKVYYHRHVASIKVGRWLRSHEHVHHIDGDITNNDPDNLMIVRNGDHNRIHRPPQNICVVCEERTYNKFYCSTKCQDIARIKKKVQIGSLGNRCEHCLTPTNNKRFCSQECSKIGSRKVERPSIEQLRNDISSMSWVAMGRKYGVSDNAVRKWARLYGLL